jgi:hypothetical protein
MASGLAKPGLVGWPRSSPGCRWHSSRTDLQFGWLIRRLESRELQCARQREYGHLLWRRWHDDAMILGGKDSRAGQFPAVLLLTVFVLGAVACSTSTTNNIGNCNAQGGGNRVTCVEQSSTHAASSPAASPAPPVVSSSALSVPTTALPVSTASSTSPQITGSLADVPQSPSGQVDAGSVTYDGINYPRSFQITVPGAGGSFSYDLAGQWSKVDLYIAELGGPTSGTISLSVSLDDESQGGYFLVYGSPYAVTLTVTGVHALIISLQNGTTLAASDVQVAGNLYH